MCRGKDFSRDGGVVDDFGNVTRGRRVSASSPFGENVWEGTESNGKSGEERDCLRTEKGFLRQRGRHNQQKRDFR